MATYTIGCKINLNLHIVGRKENGYHLLDSLFYPINTPFDTIKIEESAQGLEFFCDTEGIDLKNNTITQIYEEFGKATQFYPNLKIILNKGIPHGAGLGGGSADAAFVLKYLFALYKEIEFNKDIQLSQEDLLFLIPIALKVGTDIIFFLYNIPMRVEGIGEKCSIFNSSPLKGLILLLISPNIKVNTIEAYKHFRQENPQIKEKVKKNDTESLTSAITQAINPYSAMTEKFANSFFVNDLEPSVFSIYPQIGAYKAKLLELNAKIALMSGSGSSLYGIFTSKEDAEAASAFFIQEGVRTFPLIVL